MYRRIDLTSFRTAFIIGSKYDEKQIRAICHDQGIVVVGAASSANVSLQMIDALAAAPHLIVASWSFSDMDVADFLLSLSQREWCANVVLYGIECPRLKDTFQTLACSLGLPATVGIMGAVSLETFEEALRELGEANMNALAAPRVSPVPKQVFDTSDIRTGLLRSEFELFYQPKVRLSDGSLCGAEALLRWHHPHLGLLSPASFLRNAEDAGLAELMTTSVLNRVLADMQIWAAMGRSFRVSINFSPLALENPHLADQLIEMIGRSGVRPGSIAFEVTKYVEICDLSSTLRNVLKLRMNGHPLSLGNFGAGHASILQLARVPFTELKADQKLVHDAWKRPHLRPLLKLVVETARALGIVSVAEGIETKEDLKFVQSLGFEMGQGFLIARPMPAHLLPSWVPQISFSNSDHFGKEAMA